MSELYLPSCFGDDTAAGGGVDEDEEEEETFFSFPDQALAYEIAERGGQLPLDAKGALSPSALWTADKRLPLEGYESGLRMNPKAWSGELRGNVHMKDEAFREALERHPRAFKHVTLERTGRAPLRMEYVMQEIAKQSPYSNPAPYHWQGNWRKQCVGLVQKAYATVAYAQPDLCVDIADCGRYQGQYYAQFTFADANYLGWTFRVRVERIGGGGFWSCRVVDHYVFRGVACWDTRFSAKCQVAPLGHDLYMMSIQCDGYDLNAGDKHFKRCDEIERVVRVMPKAIAELCGEYCSVRPEPGFTMRVQFPVRFHFRVHFVDPIVGVKRKAADV